MTEAARASETSVDIYLTTRQYIPEDSELHTRRRENLKSHELWSPSNQTIYGEEVRKKRMTLYAGLRVTAVAHVMCPVFLSSN
jgi:hypothetical protein